MAANLTNLSTATSVGHRLASLLRIKLNYHEPVGSENLTRGESVFSVSSADEYIEAEPTVVEWLHEITPASHDVALYLWNLFPFLHWIGKYNAQWALGDLIAG